LKWCEREQGGAEVGRRLVASTFASTFFKHFLFASPKKKIVKQIFLETASEFKFFGTLAFLGKRKFL
jgi:hypothetical protein